VRGKVEVGCAGVLESGSCGSSGRPFAADVEVDVVSIMMSSRPQEDEVRT
jgi:hypothetical protein